MNDDPISRIKATLDFAGSQGWHPFHCDDICALLAEVDRLRRDAARYRWLRNEHQLLDPLCRLVWKFDDDRLCSDWVEVVNIDADIDAAIEEQQ